MTTMTMERLKADNLLSFSSKPLGPEDLSFLVFGGTIRLLGMVVDGGGLWTAVPWYSLNGNCEPERNSRDLCSCHNREDAVRALVDEAKAKGRYRA